MLENTSLEQRESIHKLCDEYRANNHIDPAEFEHYDVKRGLRNHDGTGVMAGLTQICNVHGYMVRDNDRIPDEGELTYRGINISDIISGAEAEDRFGYEEVVWLLLFGSLPTKTQLEKFCKLLNSCRELPQYFAEDMIMKAPSPDIMNKLARSVLVLYSYDDTPEDISLENVMMQSINLIAKLPVIMSYAYQVKRRYYDRQSIFLHPINPEYNTAQTVLQALRPDQMFTKEEARLLDLCLILHAEHGGGNNSTFTTRVLSSSGTDTYSAIGAAIGSLKGPKHGGANHQVMRMMNEIKEKVRDWEDDQEICDYLSKIVRKEAGDGSGLIYGMGHAIYTISDPRAVELRKRARVLAAKKDMLDELQLFERVERLAPSVFAKEKGDVKVISANVDFYSGLVYEMLGIPNELYTPLFAVARMAGWCAHRMEEITTGGRIMRPAYKAVNPRKFYLPMDERN